MSFNQGSISFDTPASSGAPFAPGSARNGISIDAGGFIVLGQDVSEASDPGKLLNDRQIPMEGFALSFLGSTGAVVDINDDHLEEGGLGSPDAYVGWIGTPNNYGTAYPGHGVAERFHGLSWQRFDGVNTYPRPNVVGQFWAYNYDTGGARIDNAEAGFGFRTETDFDLNGSGNDTFELHLPEVAAPSGLVCRLWSFYTDKTTLATAHQSQVQNYNFNTKNENMTYLGWNCATSGALPGEDRLVTIGATARGNNSSITVNFNDQDLTWAPGQLMWDRGSLNLSLDASGGSINNRLLNITANSRLTGVIGSGENFFQVFKIGDEPTLIGVQMFADTFANNPTFIFDRRLANGTEILTDGLNGGEVSWTSRNLNLSGIVNGTYNGGTAACYDLYINGFDTDSALHNQMIIGRNGNTTLRGALQTGDPGSGPALWMVGGQIATAVTLNLTAYVEVNIAGTLVKLAICN